MLNKMTRAAGKKKKTGTPSSQRQKSGSPRSRFEPDWWVLGLSILGLGITAYLTVVAFSGSDVAFCTTGSGCDVIQNSRWSTVLGVPVAFWGFLVYLAIALCAGLMKPRLKRWRRLWFLSFLGLAISIYLTLVGIISLNAVCAWCLASLAVMTAIFIGVILRRPDSAPGMVWRAWLVRSATVALTAIVLLHVYYSGLLTPREDPKLEALAIHLQENGAKFYGASWCPRCDEQKDLFGASAHRLPYIECSPDGRNGVMAFVCVVKDIRGYPTWIIDGERYRGVITPEQLARYSGFNWEKSYADDTGNARSRLSAATSKE